MHLLRPIEPKDNPQVAALIRAVMPEFGACGPGYAIMDPEVDDMHGSYAQPRSAYFVIVEGDRVLGGGGIAPLAGGDEHTCELRKMYFLPELRGKGLGQKLFDRCIEAAREHGFTRVYIETLQNMTAARKLYERNGCVERKGALGATGHFGCDCWYVKDL